jgi:DNA primase catalytic subunit
LISEEKFSEMMEEKISEKELIKIIADCLGEDWGFESEFRGFFIWVC